MNLGNKMNVNKMCINKEKKIFIVKQKNCYATA